MPRDLPRLYYARGKGGLYGDQAEPTFYSTRPRGGCPRFRRGSRQGQQNAIQDTGYSGNDMKNI